MADLAISSFTGSAATGSAAGSGLSLRDFARTGLAGWRLAAALAVLATVLAILGLRLWPPAYTATMVVGPTARSGAAAMGARLPASLRPSPPSMVEHGAGDEVLSDFARFLHLLTTAPVAERLIATDDLLPRLFPERWDAEARRWRPAGGISGTVRRWWLGLIGREDWITPDADAVSRHLRRRLVIEPIGASAMRRLIWRDTDRALALTLLVRLHRAADDHLRSEAARRNAAQIAHIRTGLAEITLADHRRALTDLLAEHERAMIMLPVDLPFAADSIEPPNTAGLPDWPNPTVVITLAAAAGLAFGLFLIYARSAWRGSF